MKNFYLLLAFGIALVIIGELSSPDLENHRSPNSSLRIEMIYFN